jgi:hypothetical protein
MNGALVSVLHGAPLRLRCENELAGRQFTAPRVILGR